MRIESDPDITKNEIRNEIWIETSKWKDPRILSLSKFGIETTNLNRLCFSSTNANINRYSKVIIRLIRQYCINKFTNIHSIRLCMHFNQKKWRNYG